MVGTNVMHSLFLKETLRQGLYFTQPESVNQIPSFVQHYDIVMDNYVISNVSEYKNFNEFFTRAILPEKRPIHEPEDDVWLCVQLAYITAINDIFLHLFV